MALTFPFDPIRRAEKVERLVMRGEMRKYYRFRFARYYGGIATADAVGCNLLCAYCWNYYRNLNPWKYGTFYSSKDVASNLRRIALKRNISLFRISGAEPILGLRSAEHLIKAIKLTGGEFILETNGLMIGEIPEIASILSEHPVSIRVSIKGWDEKSFEKITGARGEFFKNQLKALKILKDSGLRVWIAIMYDVFGESGLQEIVKKLNKIGFDDVELEYLEKYPFVVKNLRNRGILL